MHLYLKELFRLSGIFFNLQKIIKTYGEF